MVWIKNSYGENVIMRRKILLFLLCLSSIYVMGQVPITRKSTPQPVKTCTTCGKPVSKCSYKGNHPVPEPSGYYVNLSCNVTSATIYIDGQNNGIVDGPVYLKTGSHQIMATADGYEDFISSIEVGKSNTSFSFFLKRMNVEALCSKAMGLFNKKEYAEAVKWFEKAADLGYAAAQFEVGCTYKYGWHVEKDYKKAVNYFNLAIEQGNKSAMFELGGLYELGHGVEQNMEKAKELYQKYKADLE